NTMNNRHQWRFNVQQKMMEQQTIIYLEFIRKTVMPLPGVNEKPCYSTPGFYAGKNLFSRLREDGETLVVYNIDRDKWIDADPTVFYVTDHYLNTNYMLVDLKAVKPDDLKELLVNAWRSRVPPKLLMGNDKNIQ
ncbi:MAG: hypothetical protein ABIN13_15650, partial [Mucilaginibacter sp.]